MLRSEVIHSIQDQLILHEDIKLKPYRCTAGKLTIGVGRNLEDKGISKAEALFLLDNDIAEVEDAIKGYDWVQRLDPIRRKVIVDMAFNLGVSGLRGFRRMIAALEQRDYEQARIEMMDSKWFLQVKTRGIRLVEMMRTGKDYKL